MNFALHRSFRSRCNVPFDGHEINPDIETVELQVCRDSMEWPVAASDINWRCSREAEQVSDGESGSVMGFEWTR
jgi:hypothetical protein